MPKDSNGQSCSSNADRRTFLKGIGVGSVALTSGVAGCLGDSGGSGGTSGDSNDNTENSGGGDEGGNEETTSSDESSGGQFDVGVAIPQSGDLAVFGPRNQRGINLALKDINEAKVLGKTINTLIEDTQTSPESGVSAAQKLVNQAGVPLLMGSVSSGVSTAMAKSVTIPNKIAHTILNGTSPAITELDDDQYVYRCAVSDALQGRALAQVALNDDIKSTSIVLVNNDYGLGFADAFESAFTAEGGTVISRVPYESGKSSYKPQLNKAMEGQPEAITFIAYPKSFSTMIKQAYEMGLKDKVQYIGGESMVADSTEQNVPAKAFNGMIGTNPSPPKQSEEYKQFASSFKEEYDKNPTVWAAYAYDAMNLNALAIQKSGSYESKAIRDAVYEVSRPEGTEVQTFSKGKEELEKGNKINYQGVSGSVDLNESGDVPGTYQRWVVEDGKFVMKSYIEVES